MMAVLREAIYQQVFHEVCGSGNSSSERSHDWKIGGSFESLLQQLPFDSSDAWFRTGNLLTAVGGVNFSRCNHLHELARCGSQSEGWSYSRGNTYTHIHSWLVVSLV
uniref:Ricin B-type lectin domain-containing protein n=1 Tax=Mesocestoides corti TaxID=53468 RepID=A0A5K3FEP9_MESCO